jgi:hypothetical protein
MFFHRSVSVVLVLAVLVGLLTTFGSASASSLLIDFEQYTVGTPLSGISEPGVSFQASAGLERSGVESGGPSGNLLGLQWSATNASLTVKTNPSASAISFDYVALPFQTTTVTFYHQGAVVHSATLTNVIMVRDVIEPTFETFTYEGLFDRFVISMEAARFRDEMRGPEWIAPRLWVALDNIAVTLSGSPSAAPDDRLNWGYCDLDAVIYQRTGPDGTPALHVYGVDGDSNGHFLLDVTGPDLAPYVAEPPQGQNVLIEQAGNVQLYALISGEFSLHIHMDGQGNVCAWVFDGLPPVNTHVVNYNMAQ